MHDELSDELNDKLNDEPNIINIDGFNRFCYKDIYHDNKTLINLWVSNHVQIYMLGESKYGCFISGFEDRVIWFECKKALFDQSKIHPFKNISLVELLEQCDSQYLDPVIFNLDKFNKHS